MTLINKIYPLLVVLVFTACKKDTDITQPANTNNNPPASNILCEGITSQSNYPLAIGNIWELNAEVGNNWVKIEVKGTETLGGKEYLKVSITESGAGFTDYLRMDANGDVYRYIDNLKKEFLEIPASPTANQEWDYPTGVNGMGKRKVLSTTLQIKTAKCTYTNCISVQEIDGSGNKQGTFYYKKGLGLIKKTIFSSLVLTGVTLK